MTTDNNLDFTQQHTLEPWTVNNFRITPGLPERRRHKRIAIALPVILEIATGVTRDVSASGAFFWVSGTYAIGEPISFGMGRKTEAGKSMLKCRGVVVRTEPRGDDVGVAVRVTGSPMEPVPSHLRGPDLLKSAHDQPSNITQRKDDELQGQEVLGWAIPSAADGTTPQSLRVRVCSVTVVGVVSHVSQVLGHRGIPGGKYRDLDQLHSNAETNARRNATEVGVGVKNKFVKSRNPHDGCSVRIDLEVYVANASQDESTLDKAPLPKVVVRTTSVGGDDHRQEFDENRHTRKSYGDPTEAFEAFLMLAIESAILINLGSHRVNG
jgi:hypothetical protein